LAGFVGAGAALVGTAAGATVSWLATSKANRTALEAVERSAVADHGRRLWEERAALYVDLLAQISRRRAVRNLRLDKAKFDGDDEALKQLDDVGKDEPAAWFRTEGRVYAFASDIVRGAYGACFEAASKAYNLDAEWRDLIAQARANPHHDRRQHAASTGEKSAAIREALRDAEIVDDFLAICVRTELQAPPAPPEPEPKRSWYRLKRTS